MRQTYKPDNFKYNHQFSFEFFIDFTPTFHPVILNIFSVFDWTYSFLLTVQSYTPNGIILDKSI